MAFDVYPTTLTNPLNVAAAATSAAAPFTEQLDATGGIGNGGVMYMRFCMSNPAVSCVPPGPDLPGIFLIANGGAPVEVTQTTAYPTVHSIFDSMAVYVAAAGYTVEANGVYMVEVHFFVGQTGSSWEVQIQNNAGSTREFTWVAADTLVHDPNNPQGAGQGWLDISSTTPASELNYDTLIGAQILVGQTVNHTLQVANKGTGPLRITDVTGVIGASNYEIISVPGGDIDPNSCDDMVIAFNAPATAGVSGELYNIGSNDSNALTNPASLHNRQVTLTATSGKLELMLLLDTSGSMPWTPTGDTPPANPNESRWGRLKTAASASLTLLGEYGDGAGRFGISMFPDITQPDYGTNVAPPISSADFYPPNDIDVSNTADAVTSLDDYTPLDRKGKTPMGHGIERVIGTAGSGNFEGSADSVLYNRRWMVLMTDGAHNSGPPDPSDFYKTSEGDMACVGVGTASADRSLADKGVRVITVGYGDESASNVDHETLNTLACKSNGLSLDAGVNDLDPIDPLAKQIRGAIIEGLNLEVGMDPSGILTAAKPEIRPQIQITPYDSKVTFVTDWDTFDESRVNVQLLTPTCELITPKTALDNADITYHSHPRYKIYTIGDDYLRNASNPENPRYGVWTLIISGNGLDNGASEPYQYEVMMESRLKLKLSFDKTVYFAGDPIEVTATITLDGKGIPYANATLNLTAPGQSVTNWLANTGVTKAEYAESAKLLEGAGITAIGIKSHAIKRKGLVFNNFKNSRKVSMVDENDQGIYTATISNTSVTGSYKFYVTVTGQTQDDILFRRELQRQLSVGVRPLPDFTWIDTVYTQVYDDQILYHLADIKIWPRDHFGNVVLVDPEINSRVVLGAQGGEFTGPLRGNLDGSYSQQLRYTADIRPVINLQMDGYPVIERYETAPITGVNYADKLIGFALGSEAEKGANLYSDPRAALGDFMGTDSFVSLGANGSITLGVIGESFLAQGDDDITVFVHSDPNSATQLRSYEVQAQALGERDNWNTLGQSAGTTQSFSLSAGGLNKTDAIRINDTSGVVLDNFKASNAPGVSIMGVGFNKSGLKPAGPEGWLACIIEVFRCLFGRHK